MSASLNQLDGLLDSKAAGLEINLHTSGFKVGLYIGIRDKEEKTFPRDWRAAGILRTK